MTDAEIIASLTVQVEELTAECERHRKANLVRAVLGTTRDGDAVEAWVTEAINAEDFQNVPWMIAESFRDEAIRSAKQCIEALAEVDRLRALLAEKRIEE